MKIQSFLFPGQKDRVRSHLRGENWPVVYLIHGNQEVYVGETTSAATRYGQHEDPHGQNWQFRRRLDKFDMVYDERFNKSAILDIEQNLIKLIQADAAIEAENKRPGYKLQNRNGGQSAQHDYYQRAIYLSLVKEIWDSLRVKKIVANSYETICNSDLFKYSPYNSLTPEQEQVSAAILRDMMSILLDKRKGTALIHGGAGTGKSIVLIHMIATLLGARQISVDDARDMELDEGPEKLRQELLAFYRKWKEISGKDHVKVGFVVPMSSIRSTFKGVFSAAGKSMKYLSGGLVIGPNAVVVKEGEEDYDVVFVDEAHRLKRRRAMSGVEYGSFDKCCEKLGIDPASSSQLDFILRKSKYRIMVYDPGQTVKSSDIPHEDFMAKVSDAKAFTLHSQMRCNGGTAYVDYLKEIFSGNAQRRGFPQYDFRLYEDPNAMIADIQALDGKHSLCRCVAGYAWEWVSKPAGGEKVRSSADLARLSRPHDIVLEGQGYYWNASAERWILQSRSDEIGCIHTTQGYDLNYVGVILGPEIDYDPIHRKIVIDRDRFYDDKVKEGADEPTLLKYIVNSYMVMMARGIKGCYVYACNDNLREYLSSLMDVVSRAPKAKIIQLPLYSLRAACGRFESEELPQEEGWVEASVHGFTPDPARHFVIHAKGNSMLPKIKDGDLCVFEWYKAGSREGEIVLTECRDNDNEYGGKYTIKKYHSNKVVTEEGWSHSEIELIPLNKDYDVITLDADETYRTIAIFKSVLNS